MKTLIVDTNCYRTGRFPQKLYTEGAGNCSVVAIYDPPLAVAVMGHFPDFDGTYPDTPAEYSAINKATFEEMMSWASDNLDLKISKAVVSGMMLYSMDGTVLFKSRAEVEKWNKRAMESRQNLVSKLAAAGIPESSILAKFHQKPNRVTSMELDLETRTVNLSYMNFTNWSRRVEEVTMYL